MPKILIIDDETMITEMLALRLEKSGGYLVLKAFDGEEGLRLALEQLPDLILLDIMLPRMDGYAVLKHLRENEKTRHLPVIILTASVARLPGEETRKKGVVGFITKPFSPQDLMEKVERALAENK